MKPLTLKEELEILRGESIQVFAGDPMDIPCIETSNAEKLCKHPVVSVHMMTYNHEPYIREAIEGVMMQKTDFEFELVIGEDCSTDKTREICFDYQKRFPDKIRVLWCDHNLCRNSHPAGGNATRTFAHCRGEFIAFCEGDDYWIDSFKLQKQVDVLRNHPNVGLCFTDGFGLYQSTGQKVPWSVGWAYDQGVVAGKLFAYRYSFGCFRGDRLGAGDAGFLLTASLMIRKAIYSEAEKADEIFNWCLSLGDAVMILGLASRSDVYYLQEQTVVYRQVLSGSCNRNRGRVMLDGVLVRLWFGRKLFGMAFSDIPYCMSTNYLWALCCLLLGADGAVRLKIRKMLVSANQCGLIHHYRLRGCEMVIGHVRMTTAINIWLSRYFRHVPASRRLSPLTVHLAGLYQKSN